MKGNKTTSKPAKNSYYSHQPYDRKQYPHWQDTDKDCQNTRHELLIAQSLVPVKFKRNKGCTVTHGKWFDPYTNRTWTKASDVDIDHVVPLFHAHTHNAAQWDRKRKGQFANDPENLLIVEDNANQSKSAQAPHEWMPDNTNYHCEYLKKWVYVKTKYNLRMSKDESRFVKRRLSACSN